MEKAKGFPGLTATCHQRACWPPSSSSTIFTMSRSPTLTPPLVITASQSRAASDKDVGQCSRFVARPTEVYGLEAVGPQPGQ